MAWFGSKNQEPKEVRKIHEIRDAVQKRGLHPVQAFFTECMLCFEDNGQIFSKAGIFICTKDDVPNYQDIIEFWFWSSIALIENTWLGRTFYSDLDTSLQWQEIPVEEFSDTYLDLIHNYKPEDTFQQQQTYGEYIDLEAMTFIRAFRVMDTDNFKSMVASTQNGYLSLFEMSEEMIRQQRTDLQGGP